MFICEFWKSEKNLGQNPQTETAGTNSRVFVEVLYLVYLACINHLPEVNDKFLDNFWHGVLGILWYITVTTVPLLLGIESGVPSWAVVVTFIVGVILPTKSFAQTSKRFQYRRHTRTLDALTSSNSSVNISVRIETIVAVWRIAAGWYRVRRENGHESPASLHYCHLLYEVALVPF